MKRTLDKEKSKIILLEDVHKNAEVYFREKGYKNVTSYKNSFTGVKLQKQLNGANIIGIRSQTQLTKRVITASENLVAIGAFCIGTNQIDLQTAKLRGIPVFNAPLSNTRSVAELVIAEIIMLMRGVPQKNFQVHNGIWEKDTNNSHEVRGKTLGIIGYGHIGSQVSILAESLGMKVYYFDFVDKLSIGNATSCETLNELLKVSDVVTVHVPAISQTKNMLARREFKKMKSGSFLINASRGEVVIIKDLVEALQKRKLLGAAIDVYPVEPAVSSAIFKSSLQKFPNVILTPHIGGSTQEAQENIALEVADKLVRYNEAGDTFTSVNFPRVQLMSHKGKRRFMHIHKNTPGVLREVNNCFTSRKIEISAQFFQTDTDIGYMVVDITNGRVDAWRILEDLKKIPGTIKTRFLY